MTFKETPSLPQESLITHHNLCENGIPSVVPSDSMCRVSFRIFVKGGQIRQFQS